MIKDNEPLSMVEAREYVEKQGISGAPAVTFIKKFVKLKLKQGKGLRAKLEKLDLMKLNPEHIVKIIDLLPENEIDLNKIFIDVGLDEDETKKILETVKEFK